MMLSRIVLCVWHSFCCKNEVCVACEKDVEYEHFINLIKHELSTATSCNKYDDENRLTHVTFLCSRWGVMLQEAFTR